MPYPDELVLPLRQHAGKPAKVCVKVGDKVERGDKVGEADGFMSVPIHASAAGTVVDVDWWPHPDGSMAEAVRIKVDRFAPQVARPRLVPHWEGLTTQQVVKAVQDAGVVGLGGAAFPTHVKLAPPKDCPVHTLIINGAECEPYLTSDHRTMVEYPDRVHFGIRLMMHAMGVQKCVIGAEKNKPDRDRGAPKRIGAMKDPRRDHPSLTVKHPQGAEKMLIHAVTGVEGWVGQAPRHRRRRGAKNVSARCRRDVACLETAAAHRADCDGIKAWTGESGESHRSRGHQAPGDLLLRTATGVTAEAAEVIIGGPRWGRRFRISTRRVIKGTTGVVVLESGGETREAAVYRWIHCGRCLDACPVFLQLAVSRRLRPGAAVRRNGRPASRRSHAQRLSARTSVRRTFRCPSSSGEQGRAPARADDGRMSAESSSSLRRRNIRSLDLTPRIMWHVVASL